jgi:hypothetical protein
MGNMYWAGAFPGLVMATAVSIGLARGLARPALKHIVWLVPLVHFAFALAVGPAVSLLYGLIVVRLAGGWAGWLWLAGALLTFGGIVTARMTRSTGWLLGPWPATTAACILIAGVLVPPFYYLIVG